MLHFKVKARVKERRQALRRLSLDADLGDHEAKVLPVGFFPYIDKTNFGGIIRLILYSIRHI